MISFKLCLMISATLLSVSISAWILTRPDQVPRPATPAERQVATQAMTSWGSAFASHK